MSLIAEFERIKVDHRKALRHRAARVVLAPSVVRVYQKGANKRLFEVLVAILVDELAEIKTQEQFRDWFEHWLNSLASVIHEPHQGDGRIYPGYQWGHASKVLTLYLREIILNSRYFTDAEADRLAIFLYIPIDDISMKRLKRLGHRLSFSAINQIDTPEKFYGVQEALAQAAAKAGVPRIWFDDNWGDRQ
jgi:hypothetical protein